jgi:hypothetical protein
MSLRLFYRNEEGALRAHLTAKPAIVYFCLAGFNPIVRDQARFTIESHPTRALALQGQDLRARRAKHGG